MIKHLGLIAMLIMWIGTYGLLRLHLPDRSKTISKHAAKSARFHVIFGMVEILVVTMFAIFIFGWFIPNLDLSTGYGVAAILGLVGAIIAAVVPDRIGLQSRIHGISAYSMAMALLAMNLFLSLSPRISLLTQIILYISIAYMVIGTLVALFFTAVFRRNALKLQVIYFLAFQIPIVLAVYF